MSPDNYPNVMLLIAAIAVGLLLCLSIWNHRKVDKTKRFCSACLAVTESIEGGSTKTINDFGTKIKTRGAKCSSCGSQEATIATTLLWVSVIYSGDYRVLFVGPYRYLIRRLK